MNEVQVTSDQADQKAIEQKKGSAQSLELIKIVNQLKVSKYTAMHTVYTLLYNLKLTIKIPSCNAAAHDSCSMTIDHITSCIVNNRFSLT